MNEKKTGRILGIAIGQPSLELAVNEALNAIDRKRSPLIFACANSHSLAVAQKDQEFFNALNDADQVVADGVGVTAIARLARINVGARIVGEAYFLALMKALEDRGTGRVFFFGSTDRVLQLISNRFHTEFPSLELCGVYSPPYREWSDEENQDMINKINSSKPDVLWIGMTAPKQEKWAYKNRRLLNASVIGSIGAAFDFFAGTVPSPPTWIRNMGLETPYRLFMEPKRLWKRVFISDMKFFIMAIWRHILGFGH